MSDIATASEPKHGSQGWKLVDYDVIETVQGTVGVFQYQRTTGRYYLDHGHPRAETEDRWVRRPQKTRYWDRLGSVEDQP